MTKQLKKGLLTVLMFVLSLALCFTAVNAFTVKADATASDPDAVAAFETLVEGVEKDAYSTALLADNTWVKNMKAVHKAWTELGNDQNFVEDAVVAEFKEAWAVLEKPYSIEIYFTSDLYNKLNNVNGDKLYKSDWNRFYEMKGEYVNATTADANVKTYLDSRAGLVDNIAAADAKFVEIDNAILVVEGEIADIQYANDAGSAMGAFDATYNRIVLASETSISEVTTALQNIYGVWNETIEAAQKSSIAGYSTYTSAVKALADQKELAAIVNDKIEKLATEEGVSIVNGQVWTKKAAIEAVEVAYEALEDSEKNNLKGLVTKISYLNDYSDRLNEIGGADRDLTAGEIYQVNVKIGAIGTVVYTSASEAKIKAAETAFGIKYVEDTDGDEHTYEILADGLDADIKANDTAENATTYIVSGYPTLIVARETYQALKDAVDAFETAVDGMATVVDVLGQFNNVLVPLYEELNTEQLAAIKVDTQADGTTYYNAYLSWQAKANSIYSAAQPVVQLIKDMMAAAPADFAGAYNDAKTAYDALDASTQAAVTNRQDLFDKTSELEGEADTWLKKVALIVTPVTIGNMEKVADAVEAFDDLTADMQLIVQAMYADEYNKYNTAETAMNTMLANIKAIADEMALLSNDADIALDADSDSDGKPDIVEFAEAVNAVKAKYEALTAVDGNDQKAYLQATYADAFAKYETAVSLNERYGVEAAIALIYADNAVTITDGELIADAEDLYADYEGAATVRNYDKLTAARTTYNNITTKLQTWVGNVNALKGGKAVAELISVDLTLVAEYTTEYGTFTTAEQDATVEVEGVKYVVSTVKAELDAIDAQGRLVANTLNTDIANFLAAHTTLTVNDITAIEDLKGRFDALTPSQQDLVTNYDAFQAAYSKLNFKTFFGNAVAKLDAEVKANVFTDEGAIMIDILKSVYAGASVELQKLAATEYATLLTVIDAYEAEGVVLIDYASLKAELVVLINEAKSAASTNATAIEGILTRVGDLEDDVITIQNTLNGLDETYINNTELATAINEVKGLITEITKADGLLATAKAEAIQAAKEYTDGVIAALKAGEIKANADEIAAIKALIGDIADEATVASEIARLDQAIEDAIEAEEAARIAADNAIKADLQAAVEKLNKTITIITIILGVVSVAMAGCLVYIFLKKKA